MRGRKLLLQSMSALLAAGALTSCHVNDATAPLAPCTAPLTGVTVQFRSGEPTMFSWQPKCGLAGIVIETAGATAPGTDLWIVHDPDGHIAGPVSYGVTPASATLVLAATPMVAGKDYRIQFIGLNGLELYSAVFTQ